MKRDHLTLTAAIKSNKLREFAEQEDARGVKSLSLDKFEKNLGKIVKQPRSKRQTSRSQDGGSSRGK